MSDHRITFSSVSLQCQRKTLMSAIDTRGVVSYPRPSWSTDPHSRGVSESTFRRLVDSRRHLPSSPLSSGHTSPDGSGEVSKLRARSRSLSPQSRHLVSLYGTGHMPLLTSHTAGESDYGSRKSSVEADAHNLDCAMTMDSTSRQFHLERLNGWTGRSGVGDWKDEREGLLMEILECQRRIQVHLYYHSLHSMCTVQSVTDCHSIIHIVPHMYVIRFTPSCFS